MRWIRRLCLACFCVLVTAILIAIFDVATLTITGRFAGCQFNGEILPNFSCYGSLARLLELVLNLPLLLIYAPLFAIYLPLFTGFNPPPSREFILFLHPFSAILVLGLTWPVLTLLNYSRDDTRGAAVQIPDLIQESR
jgi:hypothetical protein